jgi:hypothetical protein
MAQTPRQAFDRRLSLRLSVTPDSLSIRTIVNTLVAAFLHQVVTLFYPHPTFILFTFNARTSDGVQYSNPLSSMIVKIRIMPRPRNPCGNGSSDARQ